MTKKGGITVYGLFSLLAHSRPDGVIRLEILLSFGGARPVERFSTFPTLKTLTAGLKGSQTRWGALADCVALNESQLLLPPAVGFH